MDLRRLEIVAPGVSSPLVITSGEIDGTTKIEREGGLIRALQGETTAGYNITNTTPDLYNYQVEVWLVKADLVKFEKILIVQQSLPRAIQYVDVLEPINLERITTAPNRTAFGVPEATAEGDRQNFQSFCNVFNETGNEEIINASGGECRYLVQFRLEEII